MDPAGSTVPFTSTHSQVDFGSIFDQPVIVGSNQEEQTDGEVDDGTYDHPDMPKPTVNDLVLDGSTAGSLLRTDEEASSET